MDTQAPSSAPPPGAPVSRRKRAGFGNLIHQSRMHKVFPVRVYDTQLKQSIDILEATLLPNGSTLSRHGAPRPSAALDLVMSGWTGKGP